MLTQSCSKTVINFRRGDNEVNNYFNARANYYATYVQA